MEKVRLGELVDFSNGYAFKSSDYVDESNTLNCRMSNIRPDGSFNIRYSAKYLPDTFVNKYSDYVLKDGDLIIAMTDMAGDPKILGIPTVVKTDGYNVLMNQRVGKLTLKTNAILPEYLKYSLSSKPIREYFKSFAGGGVQLNIGKKEILNTMVSICDITEQKHIVKILSKITDLISKRKEQLSKLDELVKARFVELFGDIQTGDYKFETRKLGEVAEVGSSHRVFTTEFVEEGIPFYRGTEIGELANGIKPENPYRITKEHYDRLACDETKPKIGDLLMPSICNKGQVWMVDTEEPFYYKDGRVLCISPNRKLFNCKYLEQFMREKTLVEYPKLGSGSTFAEFKIFLLKDIDILIPPIELQNQFADFVEQTDKSKLEVQKSLEKLELLKKALMQKYFG